MCQLHFKLQAKEDIYHFKLILKSIHYYNLQDQGGNGLFEIHKCKFIYIDKSKGYYLSLDPYTDNQMEDSRDRFVLLAQSIEYDPSEIDI